LDKEDRLLGSGRNGFLKGQARKKTVHKLRIPMGRQISVEVGSKTAKCINMIHLHHKANNGEDGYTGDLSIWRMGCQPY